MKQIAIAQITASTNKEENLRLARELVPEAKNRGARMIAFPEFLMAFSPVTQAPEELSEIAEPIDGPFTTALREVARATQMNILATTYETSRLRNRVYDSALWIGAGGDIRAVYRKLHLYDALGFKESDKFLAGSELVPPFDTDLGPVGMMICYDLRFPELARILTLQGADILVAPSGWIEGEQKLDHWRTMIRARALENGSYVIAPDQAGNNYIGHSMVVDPFGRIVAEMGERPGLEVVDLDPATVQDVREKLPLLKNRRTDIYSKYLAEQ